LERCWLEPDGCYDGVFGWKTERPVSADIAGEQMLTDVLDAQGAGIDIEEYLWARRSGADHRLVLAVTDRGGELRFMCVALGRGCTAAEADEVCADEDSDLLSYFESRMFGATHSEYLEAAGVSGCDVEHYARARRLKVEHGEYIEVLGGDGHQIDDYLNCRMVGLTHGEIMEIDRLEIDSGNYIDGRRAGRTHEELLEVVDAGLDLGVYNERRAAGYSHSYVLDWPGRGPFKPASPIGSVTRDQLK
jgi:hypothetical protein